MIRFYAPDIDHCPILPESDSGHCVKVLRMQPGDELELTDGRGSLYRCRLLEAHPKRASVEVIERVEVSLPWKFELTVAVAPTKHLDRMEWLVEKLTEVGINRFVPLLCDRSERRELKTERLQKIAVSAMKQSLKTVLPEIPPMTPVRKFIEECEADARFICHCDSESERLILAREITPGVDTAILIGPEGDFSPAEVELALNRGFIPVTLGDNRLRTETAALFAASAVQILNQI